MGHSGPNPQNWKTRSQTVQTAVWTVWDTFTSIKRVWACADVSRAHPPPAFSGPAHCCPGQRMLLNVTQVQLQVTTVNLSLSTQGHTKEICLDSNGQDPLRRRYTTSTRHLQRYVRFVDLAQRGYMSPRRSHWGAMIVPSVPPAGRDFCPGRQRFPLLGTRSCRQRRPSTNACPEPTSGGS